MRRGRTSERQTGRRIERVARIEDERIDRYSAIDLDEWLLDSIQLFPLGTWVRGDR